MLSYRHGYHAGNAADVLKHFILTYVLDYIKKKDKGFIFIDSHAGAGKYLISDPYMQKNKDYHWALNFLPQGNMSLDIF